MYFLSEIRFPLASTKHHLLSILTAAGDSLAKILASENFYLEFMRYPTDTEIADKTGLPIAQVKRIRNFDFQFVSTEEKPDEDMDGTILDVITDDEDFHNAVHSKELREQIYEILGKLNDRERKIIIMRYGLNDGNALSLEDIGKVIGLSRERVRQIELKALNKIRNMPNITGLYDYLLH